MDAQRSNRAAVTQQLIPGRQVSKCNGAAVPLGLYEQDRCGWDKQWTTLTIYCHINQSEKCPWFLSTTEVQGQIVSLLVKVEGPILITLESCFDCHGMLLSPRRNKFNKYHKPRSECKPKGLTHQFWNTHCHLSHSKASASCLLCAVGPKKYSSGIIQEEWGH